MLKRSHLRLAVLTALSLVTLSACAPVLKTEPVVAPAPIEHIRHVPVCPVEVKAAVPAVPTVPDGAVIDANAAGHGWLSTIVAYAQAAFSRETDAKAACEKVANG